MSFSDITANYPGSILAETDTGILDNRQSFTLNGDITDNASTLTVNEDNTNAPSTGVLTIENERILYTGTSGTDTFTGLTRGYDGSSADSHSDGAVVDMNLVAAHVNTLTKELIATQTELGSTGSQTFLRVDGTEQMNDDAPLNLGADDDYWFIYDSNNTQLELNSTDVDGGGSDGVVFRVPDGSNDTIFEGGLSTDGQTAVTSGISADGPVRLTDDNALELGTDTDHSIEYDSANGWLQISDGTNDAVRISDTSLNVDIVTGTLDVGGTTLFENDRDLAVDLIPNAAGSLDLGSATREFANLYLGDDAPVQYGADQDWLEQYDSANAWWELSDGTNDAIRVSDTSLDVDIVTGNLDIVAGTFDVGGTTVLENDRDVAINLIPNADATLDIGADATRWNNVYQEISHIDQHAIFTKIEAPNHTEGLVYYDDTDKALTYYNEVSDIALQIGREAYTRVRNTTGSTINNGEAVYITGFHGGTGIPTVDLAQADAEATANVAGIATHDIGNNQNGYITTVGLVRGADTSAFNPGDKVWLSSSTPGALTNTEPTEPSQSRVIGFVARSSVGSGVILVSLREDAHALFTEDSVLFASGDGHVTEDNANFNYDDGTSILTTQNLTIPGGGNLTLGQTTADYTIQWDDPGAARTYTIPDTGTNDTFLFESRTLTGGTGINTIGDLSTDRTISIDQSFSPTWTGDHTFNDDVDLHFGTDQDYTLRYDSANTQLELESADIDGMGTTGTLLRGEDGEDAVFLTAATSAPADASFENGEVAFWVDESFNELEIKVKKSNGDIVTGTVALSAVV